MAEVREVDPLRSARRDVEVDEQTATAIERGLRAAAEGRVVPSEEVPRLVSQWISSSLQRTSPS